MTITTYLIIGFSITAIICIYLLTKVRKLLASVKKLNADSSDLSKETINLEKSINKLKYHTTNLSKSTLDLDLKGMSTDKFFIKEPEKIFYKQLKDYLNTLPKGFHITMQPHIFDICYFGDFLKDDKIRWEQVKDIYQMLRCDFAILDEDLKIKCIIELDDSSHNEKDRIKRDYYVNTILRHINLPLYRFHHSKQYDFDKMNKYLKK